MSVDAARRLAWLRALRKFKQGIRLRAKLGAFDSLCAQVDLERRRGVRQWSAPYWKHSRWTRYLYLCIRDEKFPPRLLEGFVETAQVVFFTKNVQPSVDEVLKTVDSVCKELSKELRIHFGVFKFNEDDFDESEADHCVP